jgi:hypothetical protein
MEMTVHGVARKEKEWMVMGLGEFGIWDWGMAWDLWGMAPSAQPSP